MRANCTSCQDHVTLCDFVMESSSLTQLSFAILQSNAPGHDGFSRAKVRIVAGTWQQHLPALGVPGPQRCGALQTCTGSLTFQLTCWVEM